MANSSLPSKNTLVDQQVVAIAGPDGLVYNYEYDATQQTFYSRASTLTVTPPPTPLATCSNDGLLSADDKCKLDALAQTRIGVLGFQGAGFPDDGGWMTGDIVFAAGSSGLITLERIGNVVRINSDSAILFTTTTSDAPVNSGTVYWVQDSSDLAAIRTSTFAGKLPGLNSYGETKLFLFPPSAILNPANPNALLGTKDTYPAFLFTRFTNTIAPNQGQIDAVLARDIHNTVTATVGWHMDPGASGGTPNCWWYMGTDTQGNIVQFSLEPNTDPGLLGHYLCNGHLVSKAMAVVVDYTANALATNQYMLRWWNIDGGVAIGDSFLATNVWNYTNLASTPVLTTDSSVGLVPIGTLVDVWFFHIGDVGNTPIRRYYFSRQPDVGASATWNFASGVQFGDVNVARTEVEPGTISETDIAASTSTIRDFDDKVFGLTGQDSPLIMFDTAIGSGPTATDEINQQHRATINTSIPALQVLPATGVSDPFSERPVYLWYRPSLGNKIMRYDIGRPMDQTFALYDFLVHTPIDERQTIYARVSGNGTFIHPHTTEDYYVILKGVAFDDLPPSGTLRLLSGTKANKTWTYSTKLVFPSSDYNSLVLASTAPFPADNSAGDDNPVVELLHQEFSGPCVRLLFDTTSTTGAEVSVQFQVGNLDMGQIYSADNPHTTVDDFVRGFTEGWFASSKFTQAAPFNGVGTKPTTSVPAFVAYDGGTAGGSEHWNRLEMMFRDGQLWIWWNQMLVPPDPVQSEGAVTTPYFPFSSPKPYGKAGVRMWPGTTLRRFEVLSQTQNFTEYQHGQLVLT